MKEKSESEPSSSPSSIPGPSNPGPSIPDPSNPDEKIVTTINEQVFYDLVNAQEYSLVQKFTQKKEEYKNKDINQILSEIFKDFYEAQEKLKSYKI